VLALVERIEREELIDLLGDVEPPPPEAPVARGAEEPLAALLVAEHRGECWETFAAGGVSPAFAGRALDLFRFTRPWLTGEDPARAAAELLRQIGDGYALLSHPVEPRPLPNRLFAEVVIRELGVDRWATALGHPFQVPAIEVSDAEPEPRDETLDLGAAVATAIRRHELLEVLADSPTGRTALRSEGFQRFAVEQLAAARTWAYWVRTAEEGAEAQRLVLMAEAWFTAAHGGVKSSRDL
jgi:hypothetical protein